MKKLKLIIIAGIISITTICSCNATSGDTIYTNTTHNNNLYLKNLADTSNGSAINSVQSFSPIYSPDGLYIVYQNASDNGYLYKKSATDTSNGSAITSVTSYYPTYSPDGLYIVYSNGVDGLLYKKSATDTSNGSAITSVTSDYPIYSPDGLYIIYLNLISSKLYKKSSTDTSNGSAITNFNVYYPNYSPDGLYIIYGKSSDGLLYKKSATDTSTGTAITSIPMYSPSYSPDGLYIIYKNAADGLLYKKSATDTSNGSAITSDIVGGSSTIATNISNPVYTAINASCGTAAHSYTYGTTAFSGTTCATGTGSITFNPVSGNHGYTCQGIDGGTAAGCYYSVGYPTGQNGQCSVNAMIYDYTDTAYPTGSFCNVGSWTPSSPAFPAEGQTITWSCSGLNGGSTATCSASRNTSTTYNEGFGGFFTGIGDSINSFNQMILSKLDFSFSWVGFNFSDTEIENGIIRYNGFNYASSPVSYPGLGGSCSSMISYVQRYSVTTSYWNYIYQSGSNRRTVGTPSSSLFLPKCYYNEETVTPEILYGYAYATPGAIIPGLTITSQTPCYLYRSIGGIPPYAGTSSEGYIELDANFNYVTGTGTDIITISQAGIGAIRIIPFSTVLFGFDLAQGINYAITELMNIILNIVFMPINWINKLYNDVSLLWVKFPDTYCYFGMVVSRLPIGTSAVTIPSTTPYSQTSESVGVYLLVVFAFGFTISLIRKHV